MKSLSSQEREEKCNLKGVFCKYFIGMNRTQTRVPFRFLQEKLLCMLMLKGLLLSLHLHLFRTDIQIRKNISTRTRNFLACISTLLCSFFLFKNVQIQIKMLPSKYNLLSLSAWFTVFQQEHLYFHFITRSINNPIKNYLPITTWRVCVVVCSTQSDIF